jgi:4-amino-4-deoxy-L-arabinose transferase-like glycosyltransferase
MKLFRRLPPLRLCDLLALLLSVVGFLAAAWVTWHIYDAVPHIEDEIAYIWQANLLTDGRLSLPSPEYTESFLVPFVVDHDGLRFGKYPPGWPAVLAFGIFLGLRAWVNPLLAGLGVWLTYRLGRRVFNPGVGLLAAALTVTSPFFLLNSGSLLSHPLGLVLAAGFAWAWLAAFGSNPSRLPWLPTLAAGLLLIALQLTRPSTALAVALPFCVHGLVRLLKGNWEQRRRLLSVALAGLVGVGLYLLWQYLLTGDPLLNPYTLWWPYDKVGFGAGFGAMEGGHTIKYALMNLRLNLFAGSVDLFGWGPFSWLFLPFGVLAARRNFSALLLGSVFLSLVLVYMAYWIGAAVYGPRYYYEGLFSLTIFSAAGIAWLAGWPLGSENTPRAVIGWRKLRPLLVTWLVGVLVMINLTLYTPIRLGGMVNLNGISAADQQPFRQPEVQALTPALVIVNANPWMEYGALLDLENPDLSSPLIFAWTTNPQREAVLTRLFPERNVYYYYPDRQPFELLRAPLP